MNRVIFSQKQRMDDLIAKIETFSDDYEIQSHLARYLCILISGFLENAIRTSLSEYAQNKASPRVANYVDRQLSSFQNPNMEKILVLVGSFCPEWRASLEEESDEGIGESINSIVANRHLVAHGGTVGITLGSIKRHYQNVVKLIDLIEKQCNR